MRKKILIVNWGTQSSDYGFKVAKNKGLEIYLASSINYPKWMQLYVPKKNIIITNTYDSERLIIDVTLFMDKEKIKFDAITTFFEMNVAQTADLAHVLGYKFLSPEVARRTSADKLLMKNHCLKNNLPTPDFHYFKTPEEGFEKLKKIGTPAIIKPVRSGHSYGVKYIESLDKTSFFEAVREAKAEINSSIDEWMDYYGLYKDDFLVEKYIEGDVISIDGLVQDKRVMICGITKFEMSKLPNFIQESVQIPANYPMILEKKYLKIAKKIISSIGLDNCAFHSEYRLTKKGPVLLEIAARPPGGNMTLAYNNAFGVNIMDLYLDICLGKKVNYAPNVAKNYVIHRSIFEQASGKVINVSGVQKLKKSKNIHLYWVINKGDVLTSKHGLPSSVIYYQVTAKTFDQLQSLDSKVKSTFHYKLSNPLQPFSGKVIDKLRRLNIFN